MSEKRTSEWALRIQLEKEEQRVAELQTRERQHLARIEQLEQELIDARYSRAARPQTVQVRGGIDFGPGSVAGAVARQAAALVREAIAAPLPAPTTEQTPPPAASAPAPSRWSLLEIDP